MNNIKWYMIILHIFGKFLKKEHYDHYANNIVDNSIS